MRCKRSSCPVSTVGHAQPRQVSSCQLLESLVSLPQEKSASRCIPTCAAHSQDADISPLPSVPAYPVETEPYRTINFKDLEITDEYLDDLRKCAGIVHDPVVDLKQLEEQVHKLSFQETLQIYKNLSREISRYPLHRQRQHCRDILKKPVLQDLHNRFEETLSDATEDDISSISLTLALDRASHYPPQLGNLLLVALRGLQEPSPKAQALVLHACSKPHCQGIRKRLLFYAANRVLYEEFAGWDLQQVSMYIQSISALGYTSKKTYKKAVQAALAASKQPDVIRDQKFMKSLSLLLRSLVKAERFMTEAASELFATAAHELIAAAHNKPNEASGTGGSELQGRDTDSNSDPEKEQGKLPKSAEGASMNLRDVSVMLWAFAAASQARLKQCGAMKSLEWRGPAVEGTGGPKGHPSAPNSTKKLLEERWPEVPVVEAVTAALDVIVQQNTIIKSERTLGSLLWTCATLSVSHQPFLAHACGLIENRMSCMSPRGASTCLWAFGKLSYHPPATVAVLASRINSSSSDSETNDERMGPMHELSSSKSSNDSTEDTPKANTHENVQDTSSEVSAPEGISRKTFMHEVSYARSLTQALHACATLGIEGQSVRQLCRRTLSQLMKLLEASRTSKNNGHEGNEDGDGAVRSADRGQGGKTEDRGAGEPPWPGAFQTLSNACWSAVILEGHTDRELMAPLLLELLSQGDKLQTVELAQLAQVDLAMRLEVAWYSKRKWLEDGLPSELLTGLYWLGSARTKVTHNWLWKPMGLRSHITRFQSNVMDVLNDMGHRTISEASIGGLSVDIWLPNLGVAVEVDGPMHFASNDHTHVLGATRLKRRLLRALGAQHVSVPFHEWPQGRFHQCEFLQDLLGDSSNACAPCMTTESGLSHSEAESSDAEIDVWQEFSAPPTTRSRRRGTDYVVMPRIGQGYVLPQETVPDEQRQESEHEADSRAEVHNEKFTVKCTQRLWGLAKARSTANESVASEAPYSPFSESYVACGSWPISDSSSALAENVDSGGSSAMHGESVATGSTDISCSSSDRSEVRESDGEGREGDAEAQSNKRVVAQNAQSHDMLRFTQGKLSKRKLLEKAALRNVRVRGRKARR